MILVAAPVQALEVVGTDHAVFSWQPAGGSIVAYVVLVSRNDGPLEVYAPQPFVNEPRVSVTGTPGDTVRVAAWALGSNGQFGAGISPLSYPVRFSTTPSPPTIAVSTPLIQLTAVAGVPIPNPLLSVINSGGGTLDFQISSLSPWVSASPSSGSSATEAVPLQVAVDIAQLPLGVHYSALTVRPKTGGLPTLVPILVTVFPPIPEFHLSDMSLSVSALLGQASASTTVSLDASLAGARFRISTDRPWLRVREVATQVGDTPLTLTLDVDPAGLQRGTHSASLWILPEDERAIPEVATVTLTVVDPAAAPRVGSDFNADGREDLVFRDRLTGHVETWLMDGATRVGIGRYPSPFPAEDWVLAAVADLDGDRRADLLWQDLRSGIAGAWMMNGVTWSSVASIPTISGGGWQIAGAGDFDGDGWNDILWFQATTGRVRVVRMQGTRAIGLYEPNRAGETVLEIAGLGDFDASGTADVVWRTASGFRVWLSRKSTAGEVVGLDAMREPGWSIVALADQDGDGRTDLVWRNDVLRETRLWRFESPTVIDMGMLPDVRRPGWSIVHGADLDGNGRSDLLWRNASTGETTVWSMDGFDFLFGKSVASPLPPSYTIAP